MDELIRMVNKANTPVVKRALKGHSAATVPASKNAQGTKPAPVTNRTSCEPDFADSDRPVDILREVDLFGMPLPDFTSTKTRLD